VFVDPFPEEEISDYPATWSLLARCRSSFLAAAELPYGWLKALVDIRVQLTLSTLTCITFINPLIKSCIAFPYLVSNHHTSRRANIAASRNDPLTGKLIVGNSRALAHLKSPPHPSSHVGPIPRSN